MLSKILKIFPWVGMICFAYLWLNAFGSGIGINYMEQSYDELETTHQNMKTFVMVRKKFSSDKDALESLGIISDDQYSGKYAPYKLSSMGLVKFDNSGAIQEICGTAFSLNGCPDFDPKKSKIKK